jgi:short-subunit dehydrogenase
MNKVVTNAGVGVSMLRYMPETIHSLIQRIVGRTVTFEHVVITGASSGLGAALAERYASTCSRLSLFGRDQARLADVAARCARPNLDIGTIVCDVRDADAMIEALGELDDLAPVSLLLANAGIGGRAAMVGPSGEIPSVAHQLIATNFVGLINTVAPLLPRFVQRRSGHVVIISSLAAFTGLPQSPVYAATKAAARSYGEGLRRLLAPSGVGVTIVYPGFIDTPMSATLPAARPMLIPPDQAAARIFSAVRRRRPELAFPWPLALAARADRWLPIFLGDFLMARASNWNNKR